MSRSVKLAVIPGDGIGPEVIAEAVKVLDAVTDGNGLSFEKTHFSLGADRYLATGDVLTDDDLAAISAHDAILLGAVGGTPGDPRLAGANIERGLLLKLRFSLDHYVNLRPTTLFPGIASPLANPGAVDFVVVREGTEGPYVGNGGSIRQGTPHEIANEVSVNTAFGVERVVRYAFEQAARRRKKLTLVHKTNVLTFAGGLWKRIVDAVAAAHPDVAALCQRPRGAGVQLGGAQVDVVVELEAELEQQAAFDVRVFQARVAGHSADGAQQDRVVAGDR